MKTSAKMSAAKLRGGFYTPPALVDKVLRRLGDQTPPGRTVRVLEPSAGDGAFLRGIERSSLSGRVESITAVEIIEEEAARCRETAAVLPSLSVEVINKDFLQWQQNGAGRFGAAVGNPPFVRFHFVDDDTKRLAGKLAEAQGLPVRRVSNLWIPILLGALTRLDEGGSFAFIVPAECLSGVSAGAIRTWLLRHCEGITLDLFGPGSFPDVLQEIVILSGRLARRERATGTVTLFEHETGRQWSHEAEAGPDRWTKFLLSPDQLAAVNRVQGLPAVSSLLDVAKFEVAAVTGANAFFSVSADTVNEYGLHDWAVPLLPRIRNAPGLVLTVEDHAALVESGSKSYLLDFEATRPDPMKSPGARRYLAEGEAQDLHRRYKTRIREPWYRIPHIRKEQLLLSKRSHWHPRVVLNEAEVVTTDTIYRGRLQSDRVTAADLAAAFHSSLTLLTAELEGRSLGGGVLELVPSEIAALSVATVPGFGSELNRFDDLTRNSADQGLDDPLVAETNAFLAKADVGLTEDDLTTFEEARQTLARRRLDRNG